MSPRHERRRLLKDALDDLAAYRTRFDRATFLSSRDAQRMVWQAMYPATQICLDEAAAECRVRGLESGDRYRESFLALGRAGVLDADLAMRLADWASFRNLLAHLYADVDLERIHAFLSEVDDLRRFAAWLDAAPSGPDRGEPPAG